VLLLEGVGYRMTEITPEALDETLKMYTQAVVMSHMGSHMDSHYIGISGAMRRVLYSLGVLNDISNNEIVEAAIKKAERIRKGRR